MAENPGGLPRRTIVPAIGGGSEGETQLGRSFGPSADAGYRLYAEVIALPGLADGVSPVRY